MLIVRQAIIAIAKPEAIMPNHVTHRLEITAPTKEELDAFLDAIRGEPEGLEAAPHISFNRIIPMPDIIRNTESSSTVTIGLALIDRLDLADTLMTPDGSAEGFFRTYLTFDWVKKEGITTVEEVKELLRQRCPDAEEKARQAVEAYEKYGYKDWYNWAIDKWGTKWDAYDQTLVRKSDTEAELIFLTAWSPPTPVFTRIGELFPNIRIVGACFDEGWGYACAIGVFDGHAYVVDVPQEKSEMNRFYHYVFDSYPLVWPDDGGEPDIVEVEKANPAELLGQLVEMPAVKSAA